MVGDSRPTSCLLKNNIYYICGYNYTLNVYIRKYLILSEIQVYVCFDIHFQFRHEGKYSVTERHVVQQASQ